MGAACVCLCQSRKQLDSGSEIFFFPYWTQQLKKRKKKKCLVLDFFMLLPNDNGIYEHRPEIIWLHIFHTTLILIF